MEVSQVHWGVALCWGEFRGQMTQDFRLKGRVFKLKQKNLNCDFSLFMHHWKLFERKGPSGYFFNHLTLGWFLCKIRRSFLKYSAEFSAFGSINNESDAWIVKVFLPNSPPLSLFFFFSILEHKRWRQFWRVTFWLMNPLELNVTFKVRRGHQQRSNQDLISCGYPGPYCLIWGGRIHGSLGLI